MKWLALLYLFSYDGSAHNVTTVEVKTREDCLRVITAHLKVSSDKSKKEGWSGTYEGARCVQVS